MHLFSRHHVFLRCVSVFTALTFLPSSVQAWHFMPAAYAGGATDSIDLEALLDMEASLRTAAQPAIPNSPLRLVDASPVCAPRSPIPLRPEAQNADQSVSVIPAKAGIQGPGDANPASALDPRMRGDDNLPMPTIPSTPEGVPEFTEGLASKLAQAEGVANNLNLVITPTPLKDKLNHPAPTSTVPRLKTELSYVPVPRATQALPDAAAFLALLKSPAPPPAQPVLVAQAGEAPAPSAPAFDRLYYLAGPGTSPAASDLIAANALLKAGKYQEALSGVLNVMDAYSHTAPVLDAQTQFNEVFVTMIIEIGTATHKNTDGRPIDRPRQLC